MLDIQKIYAIMPMKKIGCKSGSFPTLTFVKEAAR